MGIHTISASYPGSSVHSASSGSAGLSVIYNWNGFFRPIDNKDSTDKYILNQVKAGSAIPVKFSLNGNMGLSIFATGFPKSGIINCELGATVDLVEETVTAGSSSLSYDPLTDQYNYVWKTEKSYSNCRQLQVTLIDGQTYYASFKFTK